MNYELGIRLKSDFREHHQDALKSEHRQRALNAVMGQGAAAGKKGAQGLREMEHAARSSSSALKHMSHVAASGWAGIQFLQQASDATALAERIQNVRTRMQSLTDGAFGYAKAESFLIDLSQKHSAELLTLSDTYSKILVLEQANIISTEESMQIMKGFSNVTAQVGASNVQLEQSLYGMAQGLSRGVLQAEELNQVVDPMPGLLNALDKAAGLTAGGFRSLVLNGEVTSEFFKTTLIKALEQYDGAAARMSENIVADKRRQKNEHLALVKAYEAPIADSAHVYYRTSAEIMNVLANNVDTVTAVLEGGFALGLANATGGVTRLTAEKIKAAQASKVQAAAALKEAQEEFKLATAYKASAAGAVQTANAETRLAAARQKLTIVTQRASVANRVLTASMSVLGGPAGLVTLAAFALYQFASGTEEADNKVVSLNDQLSKMKERFKDIAPEDIGAKMRRNTQTINGLTDELVKNEIKIAQLEKRTVRRNFTGKEKEAALKKLNAENAKLIQRTKQLRTENQALYEMQDKLGTLQFKNQEQQKKGHQLSQKELDEINARGDKLLANLTEQNALHGKSTNEARVRYQLEHGGLVAINKETERALILQAQMLDKKEQAADQERELQSLRNTLLTPQQQEQQTHSDNLSLLNHALEGTSDLTKRQQINQLIEAEQRRHTEVMKEINQESSNDLDLLWENTFDRFAAGIGDATAVALLESESFGDAMKEITKGVIKSVVAGLIEISVKRAAMWAADLAMGQSTIAANTAAGVASAGTLAAAYAPAAAGASLATIGTNGIPAAAALTSTYGLASTLSLTGIAHNGLRKNSNEGTYIIRRDEMMMNPTQRDNFEVLLSYVKQNQKQYKSESKSQGGNVIQIPNMQLVVGDDNSSPDNIKSNAEQLYKQFATLLVKDISRKGPVGKAVAGAR